MKIYYTQTPEYAYIADEDREIFEGYTSKLAPKLEYCCNDLEDHFWVDLDDPLYDDEDSPEIMKEPKIVLGYSHGVHGYTMLGMELGFKFCPFCGTRFEPKRIGDSTIEN